MGTALRPSGDAPVEERIKKQVPYYLWYIEEFPIDLLGGRLDKDPSEAPWLQGLYEDIRDEGRFRNPVIVWNHHKNRLTGKQPSWLLRAGSNRVWCAEQLGWKTVPALVSTEDLVVPAMARSIRPENAEEYLGDPGVLWINEHGFGLLKVNRPEDLYAEFTESTLEATGAHGARRFPSLKEVLDVR